MSRHIRRYAFVLTLSVAGIVMTAQARAECTRDMAALPLRTAADCRKTADPQNCIDNLAAFNQVIETCRVQYPGAGGQRNKQAAGTDESEEAAKQRKSATDPDARALEQARQQREGESYRKPAPGDIDGDGIITPTEELVALPGVIKRGDAADTSEEREGGGQLTQGGIRPGYWSLRYANVDRGVTMDASGNFSTRFSTTSTFGKHSNTTINELTGSVNGSSVSYSIRPLSHSNPEVIPMPATCSGNAQGESLYAGTCQTGSHTYSFTLAPGN